MKKIVALVLSLVMVLGLATTAFAATYGTSLDEALAPAAKAYTVEVKAAAPAVESAKMFATYQLYVTDVETKAVTVVGPVAELDAAFADAAEYVYVNGKTVRYFADVDTYELTMVKAVKVEAKDEFDCGEIVVADDTTYYVDAKGVYYVAGSTAAVLNGKVVYVDEATVEYQAHAYDYDVKSVNGKTAITSVFCTECKKSFSFVDGTATDAVAKFGADNYVPAFQGLEGTVFVGLGGAVATEDGDKVESAETFDAGIAMYVGMSVMAAAGSAVVLKKKD